ncbi:MAG: hypothetical protein K0R34_2569 [Herbinix sp.]|jgi:hypothetical protein|nr:hypothetical protein [Herbinix sp.]
MPKETRLEEDAVIYQPRQKLSEKQKLKDMNFQGKISYLWEYYRIHAIIIVGVIALISYIIKEVITPDIETQFYAAIINNTIHDDVWEQYNTDLEEYLDLDPKTEDVQLNYNYYINSSSEYAMNMQQALSTYIAAGEIDVIIAPESIIKEYVYYGFFEKISNQIPTDLYTSLTDYLFISDTEENAEKNVYGIYLTDTKLFAENANNSDPYVLGILANASHKENAAEFLRMLYNE